jgi:ligand-binding SRPBCC domain-containing protein
MRHTFQTVQWVPYPIAAVFAFFADPANLPRLMPAWQKARIETSSIVPPTKRDPQNPRAVSTAAGAGSAMTIRFRPFPLSPILVSWKATIVDFEWNHHFCDEQPEGPFAYWRHCHRVSEETQDGIPGTQVIDDLVYELPLGIFSEPAHSLIVRRQIEAIFRYRQQRLFELLQPGHNGGPQALPLATFS